MSVDLQSDKTERKIALTPMEGNYRLVTFQGRNSPWPNQKVEHLIQEIGNLYSIIKWLELGRQTDKSILDKEVSSLKSELKNAKLCYTEATSKIKSDMKDKGNEWEKLKAIIETVQNHQIDMDKRVLILEIEKAKIRTRSFKICKKTLQSWWYILKDKETQMFDLRKVLEDIEHEKKWFYWRCECSEHRDSMTESEQKKIGTGEENVVWKMCKTKSECKFGQKDYI